MNEGTIREGDIVEVLAEKEPEAYPDNRTEKLQLTCVERGMVARDFVIFWFAPQNKKPLPDYLPAQHLPIELAIDEQPVFRRYCISYC